MVWARTYAFDDWRRITVRSRKVTIRGDLAEVVAGGLGMWLRAGVQDGALVFESCGYFLEVGPLRIRIPHLLTPGRARVTHADLGEGRFRFSMSFNHAWAGETIFHTGVFADPEAAA